MNTFIIFFIAALLTSCNANAEKASTLQKHDAGDSITATEITTADDYPVIEQAEADLTERVKAIYDHLHRAYENRGEEGTNLDLDELYCSPDWRATVDAVRKKDMPLDGMGFFEADYWVMGQEAGNIHATDISIEKMLLDEGKASVTLKLHNFDIVTAVRVDLVMIEGQWMIDNFTDLSHDFNWRQEMRSYLRTQQ